MLLLEFCGENTSLPPTIVVLVAMAYSERSMRQVVDKIDDGSANSIDNVFNPTGLRTNIPSSVELTNNLEIGVAQCDDSMVAQDDNSNSPALLEQGTEECRQPEPFCMRNELNETIGQSRHLSG